MEPLVSPGSQVPSPPQGVEPRCLSVCRLGRVDYGETLALQERLVAEKIASSAPDRLLLLEHDAVYTLGRGADERDLCGVDQRKGVPVFRVGRGGGVTFHGPGQLVAYPIVGLAKQGRDVQRYVRALEQILIETCRRFGVDATLRAGLTGVWVGERKIASIGIGVRRWIAWHGIALNVDSQLDYFAEVVPCRMADMKFVNLSELVDAPLSVDSTGEVFADCFAGHFGYDTEDEEAI